MIESFDVIVIGSGAGGAPIIHELVKAGKRVLVLEKGPLFRAQGEWSSKTSDFKRDELISDGPAKIIAIPNVTNQGETYYSSHIEPDLNDEPHIYRLNDGQDAATIEGYTAQAVGGGTNLYGGVSFRFTPTDFQLRSFNEGRQAYLGADYDYIMRETRNWPVEYEDIEPYYCKTEMLIGINGTSANQIKPFSNDHYQTPLQPNPISQYAYEGMVTLAKEIRTANPVLPYRTPLAVITEDHEPSGRKMLSNRESAKTSYVNRYGDPLGLKSSTWVSLLRPIKDNPNLELRPNCTVTHLESDNGKVTQVHYLDPSGRSRVASGKIVVVACSAIESVRLLKISALLNEDFNQRINQNDLLGKYFLTHAFGGANAYVPGRFDKSKALDADWATDCCNDEVFLNTTGLWAGASIYNNTSDAALPLSLIRTRGSMDLDTLWKGFTDDTNLYGEAFIDYLDQTFGRTLSITFMANQIPMRDNRIELHPHIRDKWNRPVAYIIKGWHPHDIKLMNIMADQCGKVLKKGAAGDGFQFLGQGGSYQAPNGLIRIANHVLGGARFGISPNDSVLDPMCRAWEFDNLYVTDGSCMPTSGSGNPTHTIEANSFRVADELLKRL